MSWRWWPVRTVREKLRARIDRVDEQLRECVAVPAPRRDTAWHALVDELLKKRSALSEQQRLGFLITDRRRVRG